VAVIGEIRAGRFAITAEDQDVHLAVERVLTERLGDLGRKVHTARSRNDQVAVDLRLVARERLADCMEAAAELALSLLVFGRRHACLPMVGRTHLQPAMPSSVGVWASAYAESLWDDLRLMHAVFELNDVCPLGSAAGYGVPLRTDRRMTARLLGFARPHANVMHASNARGKCEAAILGVLAQAMLTLSRMAEDLVLFGMPEFDYFELPAAFCTGSSIMPQKRNPDVLELVRAKAARVAADGAVVQEIVRALPGGYSRDLQETKAPFLEGMQTTVASLRVMRRLVEGVRPKPASLRRGFSAGVFATDRALELVVGGMPFRGAYDEVKRTLPALAATDVDGAVIRRFGPGGTAAVDWGAIRRGVTLEKGFARGRRRAYHRKVSDLLGVRYPALGGR
jgi:argininosuccinate lyase